MKKAIRIAAFSDIHYGNKRNTSEEIIANFKLALPDTAETAELDAIFLGGDVFDTLLSYPADDIGPIEAWMIWLLRLCAKYSILLRVLEGTPSHDWKQSRKFVELNDVWKIGCNLRYVDDLEIEYIPEIERHVIYVPDQHSDSTEKTLRVAQALLEAKGLTQVDIGIMHGQFDYQVPPQANVPKHDSAAWLGMVREIISIGHDHHYSRYDRIVAQGSFDRLSHGEEEPKGHIRVYLPGDGSSDVTFVETANAKQFVSIDCFDLETEAALNEIQRCTADLPTGAHVRLLLSPGHPLINQPGLLQRTWPDYTWTRPKVSKPDQTANAENLEAAFASPFVAIAITPANIQSLLLERFARTAPSPEALQLATEMLSELA